MEKHKCKLCYRTFSNGRALGGHMRSHMMNLPIGPKPEEEEEEEEEEAPIQLSEETESASSSSSEEEEEEEGEDEKGLCYELRENPKKSIRLVDPEFSFAVEAGSVILQDRESETESSKNPTRRRSKRARKFTSFLEHHHQYHHQQQQKQEQDNNNSNIKKLKFNKLSKTESWVEPEPVSSISDATTEEDVAFCLMMLSRDKWKKKEAQQVQEEQEREQEQEQETERSIEDTDESDEVKFCKTRSRAKYKCETCKKVFKSYQALGGHRASHKKIKVNTTTHQPELVPVNAGTSGSVFVAQKKVHKCPVCFRVFSSGQALGGHKRTHVIGVATTTTTPVKSGTKFGDNWIDLNLPAPIDDDDISQIELSAVSDAEFVNHFRR